MKIGDRIKSYEAVSRYSLLRKSPVFIRIDGRAFHTFTRDMEKPFDRKLIDAMVYAGEQTSKEIAGFRLGYHQSDEFTFLLLDTASYETEAWFDNDLAKLVSITASLFTAHFNKAMGGTTAVFDARAFNVPFDEIPNVFIWRQRDWERNSLQMFSRHFFSQKELHQKKHSDMHEMLHEKGQNWADLSPDLKNGTFIHPLYGKMTKKVDYDELMGMVQEPVMK